MNYNLNFQAGMGSAAELSLRSENERLRALVAELEGRLGARGEEYRSNRQQCADEAWQRHEAFQTLAENSTDAIDRVDRENRHLYVNAAFAKMMALSPEAIIGRTNRELGVPDPLTRIWEERVRSIFESGRTLEIEDSLPTPSGVRLFEARWIAERGPDGKVTR